MAATEPTAARPVDREERRPLPPWPKARRYLAEAGTCWLATARPDGRRATCPSDARHDNSHAFTAG